MITYQRIKDLPETTPAELFLSVNWFSGQYPHKLKTAFANSSRVFTAWDGGKLVGLIRGLDDGAWQATIDCLLVRPDYQRRGIASTLLNMLIEEYRCFLYINVVTDEKKNASFYQQHGFAVMAEGTPMQITGDSWQSQ